MRTLPADVRSAKNKLEIPQNLILLKTQIFHICLPIQDNDGLVTSTAKYSFFCGNGTVFDQQALVCNHADDAFPCEESPSLFGSVPFGEVLEDY